MGGRSVVLDLGSGSVRQLWRLGIDVRRIDAVVLSHFHPDHTADLVPLLFALGNPEFSAEGKMSILGPRGVRKLYEDLLAIYGKWITPPGLTLDIREAAPGAAADLEGVTIRCAPSGHTSESLAFRLEGEGKSLVYGGDSTACEELVSLAGCADLLILECSFPEGAPREGHLIPSQAAAVASRAGAKRLVLTHFYPEAEEADLLTPAAEVFVGEIILATDGMQVNV